MSERRAQYVRFVFKAGETVSNKADLKLGYHGTLIVPASLNAKTVQFLCVDPYPGSTANGVDLLGTAKTVATGANPLTAAETLAVGPASEVQLEINEAILEDATIVLLWKS